MKHSDEFEEELICFVCQSPIEGLVARFRGEPIHDGCQPAQNL